MRLRLCLAALALAAVGASLYLQRAALHQWLFDLTGEEAWLAQARAVGQLALGGLRPPLDLKPDVPIAYSGVNPFGINTFLQQEVEPAKREKQVQLIAEAGFHWLRQEFPWSDIEISAKGNFEDCRFPPCYSAWDKYDQIVDLADQYGLEIIARLSSPPNWSRADGAARGDFAPPDNFTDFADYAVAVASRYPGRVRYFQIWNEPNGNDEWGYQPVDPEAYTRLLCETYRRLKAVDPGIAVLAAALTPTDELGGSNPNDLGGNYLNDLIYLQRMYNAGAKGCFDIMSAQGYGLWSGPTDRRMNPITFNYARNLFVRDLMVRNGDELKPIWISEMNWNAVPEGREAPFGRVTEAQQARYMPLAYRRAQAEWPWLGVGNFWYFKDADDHEKDQAKYYFRMADPDFTLKPVYYSMKEDMHQAPVMYPGQYDATHWAVQWSSGWTLSRGEGSTPAKCGSSQGLSATAQLTFEGTDFEIIVKGEGVGGRLSVRIDGAPEASNLEIVPGPSHLSVARHLPAGRHTVEITSETPATCIYGFTVRRSPDRTWLLTVMLALALGGAGLFLRRTARANPHA